jgi:organic hydroperoxide reductase OsmC/OhrA
MTGLRTRRILWAAVWKEAEMSIVKALRFPVSVSLRDVAETTASAPDKPDLEVAVPPEFHGGVEGVWSPEELMVASAASCFAVTLSAIAERMRVPLLSLDVSGTGHVSRRDDGRFGFVAIELDAVLETTLAFEEAAFRAVELAEHRCLVTRALDVPVHVEVDVLARKAELALVH